MNDSETISNTLEFEDQHEMGLDEEYLKSGSSYALENDDNDDMIDEQNILPDFKPVSVEEQQAENATKSYTRVNVPQHRLTPLRNNWTQICEPIVNHMGLAIRYNQNLKVIEIMTTPKTVHANAIQKAQDFCRAFCLGFELRDAIALLRLDDLYIDSFELKDVRFVLTDDNLSRAIGRVAGHGGKTKFTIENATKTRIVIADTKIHILGSYQNIRVAKRALSRLIIGTPPGKIYNQMKNVSARNKQRF
jgi:RNA-binding protein PNO1